MSGSYTGRIAPPGRPNMTSTPSISRLLIRAWAPVSFIDLSSLSVWPRLRALGVGAVPWVRLRTPRIRPRFWPVTYEAPRQGEGRKRTDACGRRALRNDYEEGRTRHGSDILADQPPQSKSF